MSTRKTNEAVDTYRKLLKAERKVEELEAQVACHVVGLTADEANDYAQKTMDIDRAVDAVADSNRTAFASAVNHAGIDG